MQRKKVILKISKLSLAETQCPKKVVGILRAACTMRVILQSLLLTLPAMTQAEDYTYTTNNGTITITKYNGSDADITIPDTIDGFPVTSIGDKAFGNFTPFADLGIYKVTIGNNVTSIGEYAFWGCNNLTNVNLRNNIITSIGYAAFWGCDNLTGITIPNSVTSIGEALFAYCRNLKGVYFEGNALSINSISSGVPLTVYYLPGTTGWGPTFGGYPTAIWQPQIQTSDASFGVRTNQFGFNITWADAMVVVVEAAENLTNPIWTPVGTNTLAGDTLYFSDPQWTNYSGRFYRIRSP